MSTLKLRHTDNTDNTDMRGFFIKENRSAIKQKISAFICACLCHLRAIIPVLFALGLTASCTLDGELGECPYNARLEYWYTGSGTVNVLPQYVDEMRQYIYDSEGTLVQVNSTNGERVVYGELNVEPGTYTIVSWANLDTVSAHYPEVIVGKSKLADMQLYMDNPYSGSSTRSSGSYHTASEKLYYGYAELEVTGRGVSRQRVYMTHSHFLLNLTVKWAQYPPLDVGNFNYRLRGVPSRYRFTPSHWIGSVRTGEQAVPAILPDRCGVRVPATMNLNRTLSGTLVCYRLTNDMHPVLGIYSNDNLIIKEVDLWKYFNTTSIDLDNNLRQEFDLQLLIDGDEVSVSTVGVGDWEDGGAL